MPEKNVTPRWVLITLPKKFNDHKDLYKNLLHPVIKKYGGTNYKCAEEDFTQSEYRFKDLATANECCKELKKILKETFAKADKYIFLGASVMPVNYEKNGTMCIVRPVFSDKEATLCKNFDKTF